MAGRTIFERLADLAVGVRPGHISAEVERTVQLRLLDAVGCMLAGWEQPTVQGVYRTAAAEPGTAVLVGDHRRATIGGASLANCTALRYLDYLDSHPGRVSCHPALIIPPVLAAAGAVSASGRDVVRAIALGYEVDIRLQLALPDVGAAGWSGSSSLGIAVPIAVGSVIGLSSDKLANALAVATDHAPTLAASAYGQMAESKSAVDGMVAMSAVTSTLLAMNGLEGPLGGFDVPDGFGPVVAKEWDEAILLGPVDRFRILDVNTKLYNTVKRARAAVSAAIRLRSEHDVTPAAIYRVRVFLAPADCEREERSRESYRRPQNRHTANHSAVFSIASALVAGQLGPRQFDAERLRDPDVLRVIDRLEFVAEPTFLEYWPSSNPARVVVNTTDGAEFSVTELFAPGHARNPVSERQIGEKFAGLAARRVAPERADAIVAAIDELPTSGDVTGLLDLLPVAS